MTGEVMLNPGEGERLEARRRRMFWVTIGSLMAAGAVAGGFVGANAAHRGVELDEVWLGLSAPVVIGLVAAALVAFLYGTWRFFKVIDEVELVDNLWGSTAAYYVYATLFPVWWVLGKAGIVSEPGGWTIYFAALAGGGVVYVWRKLRAR